MQTPVWAGPPSLPGRFHSRAMPMASSLLCPRLANLQQAHKNQKPGNGTWGKMPGMLGPPLALVHLLMLEVRAGFPTGGGRVLLLLPLTSVGAARSEWPMAWRGAEQRGSERLSVVIILSPGAMNSISLQPVWEECNPVLLETQSTQRCLSPFVVRK